MSPGIHFDVKPKYFYDHDASVERLPNPPTFYGPQLGAL